MELKGEQETSLNSFIKKLPFKLTAGQKTAIDDIFNDFKNGKRMNRLLEGDVGSGKTVVAILAALMVADKRIQTAFMAPTEVLAEQHFNTIINLLSVKTNTKNVGASIASPNSMGELCEPANLFSANGITIALLTGSTKAKDRKLILEKLKSGDIDIIIGTHALFSKDVIYKDLGLCIIDEQHRFGVSQRKQLEEKSNNANVLIMSATPIPRTLAMLFYADMDISRITDKPKNRLPI